MLNEQPPDPKRRVHPLERTPNRPPGEGGPAGQNGQPRQQVTLHIPSARPLVTYAFLGIMIAVFIIRALSPTLDEQILLWGIKGDDFVLGQGEIYRLVTAMFLHTGIYTPYGTWALEGSLHLIFNGYMLFTIGASIERLFGHARFAAIFLLGGLAGSVFSLLIEGGYGLGASGAIFALLGAELVYLYQHRKLLGARGRRQLRGVLTLLAFNVIFGFVGNAAGAAVQMGNWAHIGGFLGGLVLAVGIAPLFIVRSHPEIRGHLIAEDINPLKRRWWVISAYSVALMLILIVARQTYTPG